ncbi:macrophage mannose receptor 1-like [Cydia fagiglandana]|uniref:macrophage mannose receptor 1-like n=1 Tax=Cydia fagiglandana TaxID=1458189 RepID=UPI002FEDFEDE
MFDESVKMYFTHLIFALVICAAAADDGYEHYGQVKGWLKVHSTPTTWRTARLTCFEEGGVLASPENEALLEAMSGAMLADPKTPSYVFTGIHDTFSKGLFYTLGGTPLKKIPVPWAPGKPESKNDESCVSMHYDGMLVDSACTDELPFICFKKDVIPKVPKCGPEDNGYIYNAKIGSCYKFHREDKWWKDAFASCDSEGAYLAIINSDDEAEVLKKLFRANQYGRREGQVPDWVNEVAHIGFVDWGREGGLWMTIHGQTLEDAGYLEWNHGEPNNATNQFCGAMFINGRFDDVNCYDGDPDQWTRSFICEKQPQYVQETPEYENMVTQKF